MRQIVCEECRRRYDYDREEFCPRCGAFNQPVKVWGVDGQGNIRRVDGLNEQNHAESFVHREVHTEKRVRQVKGMDQPRPAQRPVGRPAQQLPKKKDGMAAIKILFWIIGVLVFLSFFMPLLFAPSW